MTSVYILSVAEDGLIRDLPFVNWSNYGDTWAEHEAWGEEIDIAEWPELTGYDLVDTELSAVHGLRGELGGNDEGALSSSDDVITFFYRSE